MASSLVPPRKVRPISESSGNEPVTLRMETPAPPSCTRWRNAPSRRRLQCGMVNTKRAQCPCMQAETLGWAQVQRSLTSQSRVCSYSARKGTVSLARPTSGHSTTHVKRQWKRAGMETVPPVPSTIPALSQYCNRFLLSHTRQRTVPKAFPSVPDPSRTAMETFSLQLPVLKPLYSYLNPGVPFPTPPMT